MNYAIIKNIIGKIMIFVGLLMFIPLAVCLIYQEALRNYLSFIIPIVSLLGLGFILNIKKASNPKIQAREGFIVVGLSWIVMSLFGALPLFISGYFPNFVDAFFEITSGFTTTGASIIAESSFYDLLNLEAHSILMWRSFSHWIGGMGILVFILAFIPESNEGSVVHILRAESPGPQVGRLVSRMKASSRILYLIYIALTVIEIILLSLGSIWIKDGSMNLFECIVYALGTAGTGGFGITAASVGCYAAYYQYVVAVFMVVFGINFTMYYLILVGKFKDVLKNEELRWYLCVVVIATILIGINIYHIYGNVEETFRLSFFQVATIISTTGYSTTDFALWPAFSQGIIILLMFFGSCAGSTAGGIKFSRIVILFKSAISKIKNMVHPRKVETIKIDGKPITQDTISGVQSFLVVYLLIFVFCAIVISIDCEDMYTPITASLACISNIGPGLGNVVGPAGSYASFSNFSKIILSLEMIAGRLELFPLLILFYPKVWKKRI